MRKPLCRNAGQRVVIMGMFFLLLPGCEKASPRYDAVGSNLILALPQTVAASTSGPARIEYQARIEIPELGKTFSLQMVDGKTASGTLPVLSPGRYAIRVVFESDTPEFGVTLIADASREIDIVNGVNRVTFQPADYRYEDSDGDGYSNLLEVENRTPPNSKDATPATAKVFHTLAYGTADLSSWAQAGGLQGVAAADAICQAEADAANLDGEFIAWMSDENSDAYCRAHALSGKKSSKCGQQALPAFAGPWIRTDGYPFSAGIDELTGSGNVYAPIAVHADSVGDGFSTWSYVWTGTTMGGEMASDAGSGLTCSGWSSAAPGQIAVAGSTASGTYGWTEHQRLGCDDTGRLLCFQLTAAAPLPDMPFREKGRIVFVTSVTGSGDLSSWPDAGGYSGIAAGDNICRNRAREGGLPNPESYKAWLSDSSVNAIDRLRYNGRLVRPDGVLLVESKSELGKEEEAGVFTSISVNEFGTHISPDSPVDDAWTGTGQYGNGTTTHCQDWTNGTAAEPGTIGSATLAGFPVNYTLDCAQPQRLFCIEDEPDG